MFEALHEGEVNDLLADADPDVDVTAASPVTVRVRFSSAPRAIAGQAILDDAAKTRSWTITPVSVLETEVTDGSA